MTSSRVGASPDGASPSHRIRRIRTADRDRFRALRLEALATDPSAFGSTFARESEYPDSRWDEWVQQGAESPDAEIWLAETLDGSLLGMIGWFRSAGDDRAYLWGMWVHPSVRGGGVGAALLDAVLAGRDADASLRELQLSVNPAQVAATRLYRSRGFRPTGGTEPLAHTPGLVTEEMVRPRRERP